MSILRIKNEELPKLLDVTSISVFRLFETSSISIQQLNKGFNGNDTTKGFFHVVGYNSEYDQYLFAKPIQEVNEPKLQCFKITGDFYKEWCTSLLVFNINNN